MTLSPTTIYIHLSGEHMAAILKDAETEKYYYQIVSSLFLEIETNQIKIDQVVGPFDTFDKCVSASKH